MENHRQIGFFGEAKLAFEPFFLDFAFGRIVMIIEPDFADRDAFGAFREFEKLGARIAGKALTVVGVNADRKVNIFVRFRNIAAFAGRNGVATDRNYLFEPVRIHIRDDFSASKCGSVRCACESISILQCPLPRPFRGRRDKACRRLPRKAAFRDFRYRGSCGARGWRLPRRFCRPFLRACNTWLYR